MKKKETVARNHENALGSREYSTAYIEELCSGTWKEVYRFIYYKVGNREEAEDITQETYAKALDYLKRDSAVIDNYPNFLKTIAINILRDQWRKKHRMGIQLELEDIHEKDLITEDFAESSARRELIEAAMSSLETEQRRVIELRIIKGYSAAEAARVLNKKEATIRVIQYRALKSLAAMLKKEFYR